MGREQRVREAVERQMRERMNLQRGKVYDKFGREVQAGNLILIPGGYHGEWTVQKVRPSSGLTGSDLPPNTVEVVIGTLQRFVLPDATLIGDLIQALDRTLPQQVEETQAAPEVAEGQDQPAVEPEAAELPIPEPAPESSKLLEFGK